MLLGYRRSQNNFSVTDSRHPNDEPLMLFSNRLQTGDDVRELATCNSLSVLDLSHNLLEEPEVEQT